MATASAPTIVRQPDSSVMTRYRRVRVHTERLCQPLRTKDYAVSSLPDISSTKWHLAHTTWFFEMLVLAPHDGDYVPPNPKFALLFNSTATHHGSLRRPSLKEVFAYRHHVDEHMLRLIERIGEDAEHPALPLINLGLQHEQQHQELILTDIKHVFWRKPSRPAYIQAGNGDKKSDPAHITQSLPQFVEIPEGMYLIGHRGDKFAFDNETPAHRVFVDQFRIASYLVTNGEYLEFIADGGYRKPELWLAAGWKRVREKRRVAPMYWDHSPEGWTEFTLGGTQLVDPSAPVSHVSYYEADAFARWAGARLPMEAEWEIAARETPVLPQIFGRRWQWTQSAYVAYPGYVAPDGAVGECNGAWKSNQWVLRGSSSATPPGHARITYRNSLPSDTRVQFSGIRLAT
jgi:ergothioneine biosynthesis protein EgtB